LNNSNIVLQADNTSPNDSCKEGCINYHKKQGGRMTSLRTVLALNMKAQRLVLKISQVELAEKVATSAHYIGMIEAGKKFPTPEMLERIAAALEIDAPALFSTTRMPSNGGSISQFQKQVLYDISQVVSFRIKELEEKYKNSN
jgi:transcriptional regulator with XRE-family HTH domain